MTRAVASWKYATPADLESAVGDHSEIIPCDPDRAWRVVLDADGSLVGFLIYVVDGDQVTIGAGLRPDLVGQGLGLQFIDVALDYAVGEWAPKRIRVQVPARNGRVQRLFGRAGFASVARRSASVGLRPLDVIVFEREA